MKNITKYLREVQGELNKVVWPKREETAKLALTVIIISAVVALYLGTLDFGFTKLLETVIKN